MAQLEGKGAFKAINLIAKTYNNAHTKDGKTQFLDVQVDHRDERGKSQTNLHLTSVRTTGEDGKVNYNNGAAYAQSQYDAIKEAAGPNTEPLLNKDGEEIGTVYGVKADVTRGSRSPGLIIKTDTLEQSDFKVDKDTLDNQFASMKAAKEARAAEKSAEASAEKEAPQAETAEAAKEAEEPAFG